MLRRLFAVGLGLMAVGLAADPAPVELDIPVFSGGYGTAFYEQTARAFEAVRPDIRVRIYGDPRIHDQLRMRIIDGHFPDAACVPYILWPAVIGAGKVVDLTPFLREQNWEGTSRWGDTFQPGSVQSWEEGGHPYGLPFTYSCWTIFYNKGLFQARGWQVPRTWDEFFSLCDQIKASGLAPLSIPGTRWLYPDAFLRAAYYDLAGPEAWKAMNALAPGSRLDPRFIRCAGLLQRITQSYAQAGWEGETAPGAELRFLEGRAAMTVSGSWLIHEMQGKIPESFELGTMNFPVFPEGRADPSSIQTGSDCFFVFATGDPRRIRLTIDFLKFLTSRERAAAFVRATDSPVAVRGVDPANFSPRMRGTAEMIAAARDAFNMPQQMMQPPATRQALVDSTRRLMAGELSPNEFAQKLESAAKEDRLRLDQPDRIEIRHPYRGAGLIALVIGGAGWLAAGWRRRRAPSRAPSRLRPSAAAGFVLPSLALYATWVLIPSAAAFALAFVRWDGIGPMHFAGGYNFLELLFESDVFWSALGNNLYLMIVPALVVVPLSLFFAWLIHKGVWGGSVFRVVFLFPNMLGGIAATLLWLNAYEPHGGLVNAGLVGLGRLLHLSLLTRFADFPWLSEGHLYEALIPIYLWMACGFNLILYLAAMEGIDPELYEAAKIDGASPVRQFFMITLPLIRGVIGISVVFLLIGGLNAFEMIWLLTSQEPSAQVHTLGTLLVTTLFKDFEVGRAAALAVILFSLVAVGTAGVLRAFGQEDDSG